MTEPSLGDLQESVRDKTAFRKLDDFLQIGLAFMHFLARERPTRIISPSHTNYLFFQYDQGYGHKITRPLNSDLFIESAAAFESAYGRFRDFLVDLRRYGASASGRASNDQYVESRGVNQIVYTLQQIIGCITDSFDDVNQSRKRAGQLFETLIKLVLQDVGVQCDSRTIRVPIPGNPGYEMSYELDLVFSQTRAILTSETKLIAPNEVVGSVKTTSKDRIDKIFLDKYLLSRLLGHEIPVVAIFLHDVQRARRGNSIFGINTTFKSNYFLGYTVALNRLDGVYYVDPWPEMLTNPRLREQIFDFQQFLVNDLWSLTNK